MEFFVRIYEHEGEEVADFVPADDQEGRKYLRGKVKGYRYWAYQSADPEFLVHVYYEGEEISEDEQANWNASIHEHILGFLQGS